MSNDIYQTNEGVKGMSFDVRTRTRLVAFVAMILMVFGVAFSSIASADPTPSPSSSSASPSSSEAATPSAAAPTQASSDSWSLYALSSNVSAFFGNAMAPGGAGSASGSEKPKDGVGEKSDACGTNCWDSILTRPANGGDVVGFIDPTLTPGAKNWWAASNSKSSMTIAYDSAKSLYGDGIKPGSATGPLHYMYFGAAIQGLGLDSTSTGVGNSAAFNKILGGLLVILYLGSSLIDLIFMVVLQTMKMLNPFQILFGAISLVNSKWANGMASGPGVFKDLSNWFGSLYKSIIELQWYVIAPMMLIALLASYFLKKDFDRRSGTRKFVMRILFFTIAIPLVGATYTGTLNALTGSVKNNGTATMGSTRLILSTFVDTRDWAMGARFALPEGCADVAWDAAAGTPTPKSQANVRNTALCINADARRVYMDQSMKGDPNNNVTTSPYLFGKFDNLKVGDVSTSDTSFGSASSQQKWNQSMYSIDGNKNGNAASDLSVVQNTISMLMSYAKNEHISASDFETGVKGYLSSLAVSKQPPLTPLEAKPGESAPAKGSSSPNADIIKSWFTSFSDPASMSTVNANRNLLLNGAEPQSGLTATKASSGANIVSFRSGDGAMTTACGPSVVSSPKGGPANCNLSAMSMYNMLNSDFGSQSVTVYSSGTSTSTGNRLSHSAVSAVGTGALGWFYKADVFVTLALFIFIGFTFALNMLITNIRRSFQVVTSAVGASVGSLTQAAKFVVYACVIIIEIVGTLFLFTVFQMLATAVPDALGSVASKILDTLASSGAVGGFFGTVNGSGYTTLAIIALGIAAKIFLMKTANAHRTSFLNTIELASTSIIEKLINPGNDMMAERDLRSGVADRGGEEAMGRMTHGATGMAGHGLQAGAHMAGQGLAAGGHLMKGAGSAAARAMRGGHGMGSGSQARKLMGLGAGVAGAAGAAALAHELGKDGGNETASGSTAHGFADGSPIDGVGGDTAMDQSVGDENSQDNSIDNSSLDHSGVDQGDDVDNNTSAMDDEGDSPAEVEARAASILDRGALDEGDDYTDGGVDGADGDAYTDNGAGGDQVEGGVDMGDDASTNGALGLADTDAETAGSIDGADGSIGDVANGDAGVGGVDGVADDSSVDGSMAAPVGFDSDATSDVDSAGSIDGVGSNTLHDSDAATSYTDGANDLSDNDAIDMSNDASVADSSVDMSDASMQDNDINGTPVSGVDASNAGDAVNGDVSVDGVSTIDGSNDAPVDGAVASVGLTSDAGSFVNGASGENGSIDGSNVVDSGAGSFNDGANLDTSQVVSGSNESGSVDGSSTPSVSSDAGSFSNNVPVDGATVADSSAGSFNEGAAIDTNQAVSGSNESGLNAPVSGAGSFLSDATTDATNAVDSSNVASSGAGSFNDGASLDTSQVVAGSDASSIDGASGSMSSGVAETASSGAGSFTDGSSLDTSQVVSGSNDMSVPTDISTSGDSFVDGVHAEGGSVDSEDIATALGASALGASAVAATRGHESTGASADGASNGSVFGSESAGTGGVDGSLSDNVPTANSPADARAERGIDGENSSSMNSVGDAFASGQRDQGSISNQAFDGASNIDVAAADLGQAVSDARSGRLGEAARDVAAAGGAMFGARDGSREALGVPGESGSHGSSSAEAVAHGSEAAITAEALRGLSGESTTHANDQSTDRSFSSMMGSNNGDSTSVENSTTNHEESPSGTSSEANSGIAAAGAGAAGVAGVAAAARRARGNRTAPANPAPTPAQQTPRTAPTRSAPPAARTQRPAQSGASAPAAPSRQAQSAPGSSAPSRQGRSARSTSGTNGAPGTSGVVGASGVRGTNGATGARGSNGTDGARSTSPTAPRRAMNPAQVRAEAMRRRRGNMSAAQSFDPLSERAIEDEQRREGESGAPRRPRRGGNGSTTDV